MPGGLGSIMNEVLGGGNLEENRDAVGLDTTKVDANLSGLGQGTNAAAQQDASGLMRQIATGQGPSAAQALLNQQTATAQAQASAMGSSGSGSVGQGAARRQAMMTGADLTQGLGGQASLARATEQLGGMGQYGAQTTAARGQDINAGIGAGTINAGLAGKQGDLQQQNAELNEKAAEANQKAAGSTLNEVAGMAAGAAMMFSSPEAKEGISPAGGEADFGMSVRQKHAGLYKPGSLMQQVPVSGQNPQAATLSSPPGAKTNVVQADTGEQLKSRIPLRQDKMTSAEKSQAEPHIQYRSDPYKGMAEPMEDTGRLGHGLAQRVDPDLQPEVDVDAGQDGPVMSPRAMPQFPHERPGSVTQRPAMQSDVRPGYEGHQTTNEDIDSLKSGAQFRSHEPPAGATNVSGGKEGLMHKIMDYLHSPPEAKSDIEPASGDPDVHTATQNPITRTEGGPPHEYGSDSGPHMNALAAALYGFAGKDPAQMAYYMDQMHKKGKDAGSQVAPPPKSPGQMQHKSMRDFKYNPAEETPNPYETHGNDYSYWGGKHGSYPGNPHSSAGIPQEEIDDRMYQSLGAPSSLSSSPQAKSGRVGSHGSTNALQAELEENLQDTKATPLHNLMKGQTQNDPYSSEFRHDVRQRELEDEYHVSSPPQAKQGVEGGNVEDALRKLNPYSYNYRDPANEPIPNPTGKERFFGIMTTDLKKHPVTRSMVSGHGAEEKIAIPAATSFTMASVAHLQKKVDAMEKLMRGRGRGK